MGPNKLDLDNFRLPKLRANYRLGGYLNFKNKLSICIIENHEFVDSQSQYYFHGSAVRESYLFIMIFYQAPF